MTDDNIRDLLNTAFVNEPPLRFERTAVITRGRRVIRNRWLMAAGSAVISVLVLTGGILLVAGLQQGSSAPLEPGNAPVCYNSGPSVPPSATDCPSGWDSFSNSFRPGSFSSGSEDSSSPPT